MHILQVYLNVFAKVFITRTSQEASKNGKDEKFQTASKPIKVICL